MHVRSGTSGPSRSSEGSQDTVLALRGRLDASSVGEVRARLDRLIDSCTDNVVVDLGDVDLIDGPGLAVLAGAHRRLDRAGRRLVLRGCADHVRRVLTLTRLSRVMHVERVHRDVSA